ncbi:uncharacterized protein LOC126795719 [Argentina anserina]|uniref:uncharacterized protein LOC126795719 n=1 Tax=Argentina anserina TaxID=57926 RepID=UPI0021768861|nr:uncharacterized protein LOC126795719 [Potentilla anserina]
MIEVAWRMRLLSLQHILFLLSPFIGCLPSGESTQQCLFVFGVLQKPLQGGQGGINLPRFRTWSCLAYVCLVAPIFFHLRRSLCKFASGCTAAIDFVIMYLGMLVEGLVSSLQGRRGTAKLYFSPNLSFRTKSCYEESSNTARRPINRGKFAFMPVSERGNMVLQWQFFPCLVLNKLYREWISFKCLQNGKWSLIYRLVGLDS